MSPSLKITKLRAQLIYIYLEFEISQPEWEMKCISITENPTGSVMAVRRCGEGIVLEIMKTEKPRRDLHIKIRQQTKFLGLPLT